MIDDRIKQQQLRTMRTIATSMLAGMGLLYIVAAFVMPSYPWSGYLRAFSEAAMVGALADWFAVTALFRHPMGVPLPHTAIIPKNKDRIGDGLAGFVEENFLTRPVLEEKFAEIDPAGLVARWLSDPANAKAAAEKVAQSLPTLLNALNDEDISMLIGEKIDGSLHNLDSSSLLAGILNFLTRRDRHQEILTRALHVTETVVKENEEFIREKVRERVPGFLGLIRNPVAAGFSRYLVTRMISVLEEVAADPNHPMRRQFDDRMIDLIERLRASPELRGRVEQVKTEIVESPAVRRYVGGLWDDLKRMVLDDVAREDSAISAQVEHLITAVGTDLQGNSHLREKINTWSTEWAIDMLVEHRAQIAGVISGTIRTWDAETVSRKIELQVGRDLQFIRINGTIVGGLVGLLIYMLTRIFGG